jgi:hypothetical protein
VARWNRRYIDPTVYFIKTDFGRLAKRYEAVRNAKLEELKRKYPFAGRDDEEKVQNVTDASEEGLPHPYPPQTWCYTSSIPQPSQSESLWPWHSRHCGTRAGDHASGQPNPAGINPPLHQAMARTAIAVRNHYWSITRPPRHWCGATRRRAASAPRRKQCGAVATAFCSARTRSRDLLGEKQRRRRGLR